MNFLIKRSRVAPARARRESGFSLVELLVSLAIGAILIFGATQAYVDSRNAYMVNETVARMQETARYATSVMETDLRMSNYWGLIKGAESISGKAAQSASQASIGGAAATACGNNFGLDLEMNVEGTDGTYSAACKAMHDKPVPKSDTVTIRRAAFALSDTSTVTSGPLRVCSTRTAGALVTNVTTSPLCTAATGKDDSPALINDLIVNLYYVDQDSDEAVGVPSLRRKFLTATPDFDDAEIVSNVEDMQIQYGVDTSGGLGLKSGAATRYLDAGTTLTNLLNSTTTPAQVVSIRVWLLVRADAPEVGFTDTRIYEYGSRLKANGQSADLSETKAYQPSLSADNTPTSPKHYRRILISRTFQLRNALGT